MSTRLPPASAVPALARREGDGAAAPLESSGGNAVKVADVERKSAKSLKKLKTAMDA